MRATLRWLGVVLLIAAIDVGLWFLFGWRTEDDHHHGRTIIERRWGIEREAKGDRDRDGRTDLWLRFDTDFDARIISTHDRPFEIWIDDDLNGDYDVHYTGDPLRIEKLVNGTWQVVASGDAAKLPNDHVRLRSRHELGLEPD